MGSLQLQTVILLDAPKKDERPCKRIEKIIKLIRYYFVQYYLIVRDKQGRL